MRHRIAMRKLSRPTAHRMLMLRNMVSSLIEHEQIQTTVPKAKEAARLADKIITLGKKGLRHQKVQANRFLFNKDKTHGKLFGELAQRYKERAGGYTRINLMGHRKGDHAPVAILSLVDSPRDIKFSSTAMALGRHMAKMSVSTGISSDMAMQWRNAQNPAESVEKLGEAADTVDSQQAQASSSRRTLTEEQPILHNSLAKAVNSVLSFRPTADAEKFLQEAYDSYDRNLAIRSIGYAKPDETKTIALEAYYRARREAQSLAKQSKNGGPAYIVPPMTGQALRAGEDYTLRTTEERKTFKSAIKTAKGRQTPVRSKRVVRFAPVRRPEKPKDSPTNTKTPAEQPTLP